MNESPTVLKLMEPAPPGDLVPAHGLWPWFVAAGIALLVIAGVLWLLRKRRRPGESPAALREAAYRDALAALDGIPTDQSRTVAVQASLILRKYLATAAADPALYETHEEFIARHDSLQQLNPDVRSAASDAFRKLAALKYAPDISPEPPAGIREESRTLLETLHHGFAA
jgi:LPXTG-motif cell wall-anchored protein